MIWSRNNRIQEPEIVLFLPLPCFVSCPGRCQDEARQSQMCFISNCPVTEHWLSIRLLITSVRALYWPPASSYYPGKVMNSPSHNHSQSESNSSQTSSFKIIFNPLFRFRIFSTFSIKDWITITRMLGSPIVWDGVCCDLGWGGGAHLSQSFRLIVFSIQEYWSIS